MVSAKTFAKAAPSLKRESDTGAAVEKTTNVASSAAKSKLQLEKAKKLQQQAPKQEVNYSVYKGPSEAEKLKLAQAKAAHDKKEAEKRKQALALLNNTVKEKVDRRATGKMIQLQKKHQAARSKHAVSGNGSGSSKSKSGAPQAAAA